MVRKLLATLLSVSMMFGMGTTAFAADKEVGTAVVVENEAGETINVGELLEHLNSIDFGREVTFTALPQSRLSDQELLNFDSVEAAEVYLKQFMAEQRELTVPTGEFGQNQAQSLFETKKKRKDVGIENN